MKIKTNLLVLALVASSVMAADDGPVAAPAIDQNYQTDTAPKYPEGAPPPVNLLADEDSVLTKTEMENIKIARDWAAGQRGAKGEIGDIVFRFGASVQPPIVCSPLYVCDIMLQPGEKVNHVLIGDAVRWIVRPAISGEGPGSVRHIVIKPSDIGLTTNLLVTTTRRTYSMMLKSHKTYYMPRISFSYPEDELAEFQKLESQQLAQTVATVLPKTGANVLDLDFGYELIGKARWRPERVYTDGLKTYVEFPASMRAEESPALLALGADGKEQIVNYRVKGSLYIVDRVIDRAVLISGVGRSQARVTIERGGK